MRVTKKKMNKRKQKHDEDRKHASDDDGSGEEQNKTRTTTQPGQQHGEPSRRHPAEPERQHSRKLSKRRRAEPDSAGGTHPEGDEQENAPSIPQERGARRGRQAYNTPVLSVLSRLSDQSRPPSMGGWGCVPAREHSCIGEDNTPYSAPVAAPRKASQEHPDRAPAPALQPGRPPTPYVLRLENDNERTMTKKPCDLQ